MSRINPLEFRFAFYARDFEKSTAFLIGGLGTMALASLGLFHPAIRGLD